MASFFYNSTLHAPPQNVQPPESIHPPFINPINFINPKSKKPIIPSDAGFSITQTTGVRFKDVDRPGGRFLALISFQTAYFRK